MMLGMAPMHEGSDAGELMKNEAVDQIFQRRIHEHADEDAYPAPKSLVSQGYDGGFSIVIVIIIQILPYWRGLPLT